MVSLIFLAVCLCPFMTLAKGAPAFEISSAEAARTEGAEITVSIKNNPGISSAKLVVSFDNALILKEVKFGSELGGFSQRSQKLASPLTLNWFLGTSELKADVTFATLVFAADSSAKTGDYKISATYDENDVYNLKEENIKFEVKDGTFTVTGDPEAVITGSEAVTAVGAAQNSADGTAVSAQSADSVASSLSKEASSLSGDSAAVTAADGTASASVGTDTEDGDTAQEGVVTVGATDNSASSADDGAIAISDADAEEDDENVAEAYKDIYTKDADADGDGVPAIGATDGAPTGDGDYTGGEENPFGDDESAAEDGAADTAETGNGGVALWIGIAAAVLIVAAAVFVFINSNKKKDKPEE